jgi:hypothetical protein
LSLGRLAALSNEFLASLSVRPTADAA